MLMKKNKVLLIATCLIGCALLFHSCFSIKQSSTRSKAKIYETFYIDNSVIQHFIKPVIFKTIDSIQLCYIDFTYREDNWPNEELKKVTVNFSVFSNTTNRHFDVFKIENGNSVAIIQDYRLLFSEIQKGKNVSRYSAELSMETFKKLMLRSDWTINLKNIHNDLYFYPTKKTRKILNELR